MQIDWIKFGINVGTAVLIRCGWALFDKVLIQRTPLLKLVRRTLLEAAIRIRVERAGRLVRETDRSPASAHRAEFADANYLSVAFEKPIWGSPRAYRSDTRSSGGKHGGGALRFGR